MDMLYSISDELDIPPNQRPLFCPPPQYEEFNPYEVKIVRTEVRCYSSIEPYLCIDLIFDCLSRLNREVL